MNEAGALQVDPMLTLGTDVDSDLQHLALTLASWFDLAPRNASGAVAMSEFSPKSARHRAAIQQRLRQATDKDSDVLPISIEEWRSLFFFPELVVDLGSAVVEPPEPPPDLTAESTAVALDRTAEMTPPSVTGDATAELDVAPQDVSVIDTPTTEGAFTPSSVSTPALSSETVHESGTYIKPCNVGDMLGRY